MRFAICLWLKEIALLTSLFSVQDQHCYSRLLEVIVNVWAFHSARRMVYVNPETGVMQEQHQLSGRRGQMSVHWFSYATLKSMDEELAEEIFGISEEMVF